MPIRRVFLDWSRPPLPVAVQWLVERYASKDVFDLKDVVLALPAKRAGRRLEELLLAQAEGRGWRFRPPQIVTVGTVPELLYEPKRPFASPLAQQFAWAGALKQSPADVLARLVPNPPEDEAPGGWLALAELLGRLHRELAADHHDFQTVVQCGSGLSGFDEVSRWEALADIQRRYLATLDELELWDRQTARRVAINSGECRTERSLVLIGAVDLNLQQRLMLDQVATQTTALVFAPESLAERFDDHGCLKPEAWEHAHIGLADRQIVLADDPGDQAAAVARWMAELGGRFAADEITVGVAPDQQLVPHLQQQLNECGIPSRWGVGRPLVRSSPCRLLAALADYLADGTFRALAALLRHPAMTEWLRGRGVTDDPATLLDSFFMHHLPDRLDLRGRPSDANGGAAVVPPPGASRGGNRSRAGTGTGPFFGELTHLATHTLAENTDLSPSLPARERLPRGGAGDARGASPAAKWSSGLETQTAPINQIFGAVRVLLAPLSGRRPLGEWPEPILELLADVFGQKPLDRDTEPERGIVMACERLRDGLRETAAVPSALIDAVAPTIDAAAAIRLLLGELDGDALPPPSRHEAVELLGWLELPLDDAPALAVTGLHEGAMPQSVNADLFLPNRLRRALGITDNDRRYARDAYALSLMVASRDELIVVIGRRGADRNPLVPSRLLFACPPEELPRRARWLFDKGVGRAPELSSSPHPAPLTPHASCSGTGETPVAPAASRLEIPCPVPLPAPVRSMRVTEFRDYLACPFRYYLRHRLGLAPVDDRADELDAGAFGTLLHRVLKQFADSPSRDSTDAEEIEARLNDLLERATKADYGGNPLPAVRIQIEQLRARLRGFARWQAAWADQGWHIEKSEAQPPEDSAKLIVDGEPMFLRGRIDRIDRHADTGEWIIFDYKSGESVKEPEKTHREAGQWVDLQLPLYRHLIAALGIDASARLGYIALSKSADDVHELLAEWTEDDLAEADEVAAAVVRCVRHERFWPPELIPPSFSEDFAPICQDGQLGARMAEDGEG